MLRKIGNATVALAVTLGCLALGGSALADHPRPAPTRPAPTPVITDIYREPSGIVWVQFEVIGLRHDGTLGPLLDDGSTRAQVHLVGNGAPPGGEWVAAEQVGAGETVRRVRPPVLTWDLIRLVRHGAPSGGRTPRDAKECIE